MKDWLLGKLAGMFGPKYIGATVRTIVAFVGGILYGIKGLDAGKIADFLLTLEQVLNPLALAGVAWLWSVIQKQRHSD